MPALTARTTSDHVTSPFWLRLTCVTRRSAIFISFSISSGRIGTPHSAPISRTRYTSALPRHFLSDTSSSTRATLRMGWSGLGTCAQKRGARQVMRRGERAQSRSDADVACAPLRSGCIVGRHHRGKADERRHYECSAGNQRRQDNDGNAKQRNRFSDHRAATVAAAAR